MSQIYLNPKILLAVSEEVENGKMGHQYFKMSSVFVMSNESTWMCEIYICLKNVRLLG